MRGGDEGRGRRGEGAPGCTRRRGREDTAQDIRRIKTCRHSVQAFSAGIQTKRDTHARTYHLLLLEFELPCVAEEELLCQFVILRHLLGR